MMLAFLVNAKNLFVERGFISVTIQFVSQSSGGCYRWSVAQSFALLFLWSSEKKILQYDLTRMNGSIFLAAIFTPTSAIPAQTVSKEFVSLSFFFLFFLEVKKFNWIFTVRLITWLTKGSDLCQEWYIGDVRSEIYFLDKNKSCYIDEYQISFYVF